jgi:hypothetical protein
MYSKKEFMYDVAFLIKKFRMEKNVTQEIFYLDTNIHIGRIEQGKTEIGLYTFFRICSYLDIDMSEFCSQMKVKVSEVVDEDFVKNKN